MKLYFFQSHKPRKLSVTFYVGGVWKNVKRDPKTLRLPGRRYERLYGNEPVEWYERTIPKWQYEVIEVLKHKANPVVCVTEMMEHQVQQGNLLYAGTEFADSWVMLQDGLAPRVEVQVHGDQRR